MCIMIELLVDDVVRVCYYLLFNVAVLFLWLLFFFFFQAEDGIRDLVRSRGLGDVYKRQVLPQRNLGTGVGEVMSSPAIALSTDATAADAALILSLIHI